MRYPQIKQFSRRPNHPNALKPVATRVSPGPCGCEAETSDCFFLSSDLHTMRNACVNIELVSHMPPELSKCAPGCRCGAVELYRGRLQFLRGAASGFYWNNSSPSVFEFIIDVIVGGWGEGGGGRGDGREGGGYRCKAPHAPNRLKPAVAFACPCAAARRNNRMASA